MEGRVAPLELVAERFFSVQVSANMESSSSDTDSIEAVMIKNRKSFFVVTRTSIPISLADH